jgi:hypothetical protein
MRRSLLAALLCVPCPVAALAQTPVYQAEKQYSFKLKLDALQRREWTRDLFDGAPNQSRWRLRALPRAEIGAWRFLLGVGADFNYSSDCNLNLDNECDQPETRPALLRDNYKSRDARMDLAFVSLKAARWLRIEGGRFEMPVGFTEMIWDRDLRPQGGALTVESRDLGSVRRLGLTVLGARGSHVFDDDETNMLVASAELALVSGFSLTGSYVKYTDIDGIEPMIRRQNTRVAGAFTRQYEVVDVVARFHRDQGVSTQLVADYCFNRLPSDNNKGLWLALVLGSTQTARTRFEYTYARVDKDATLAAYAGDDFFWATGWEGHRGDVGVRIGGHSAVHLVGQLQRFMDSPRPEERDHWVTRLRLEGRVRY